MSFPSIPLRESHPGETGVPYYLENLSHTLNQYRKDSQFCDITLWTGDGGGFPAHRAVLAAASPYFQTLFGSSFVDSASTDHTMEWMGSRTAQVILEFIYTGKIILDFTLMSDLLAAAEFLLLPRLKEACVSFMARHMNPKHVCKVKYLTELYGIDKLRPIVDEFMDGECSDMLSDPDLLDLPGEFIRQLLMDSRLKHIREKDMADLVLHWVEKDLPNRSAEFPHLMKCILYDFLPTNYIAHTLMVNPMTRDLLGDHLVERVERTLSLEDIQEDLVLLFCASASTPCLAYVPSEDHWVTLSRPRLELPGKSIKALSIDTMVYLLVTMEDSMAWLPFGSNGDLPFVQFWCLDLELNRWTELSRPVSNSKCFHLAACGDTILSLGIQGSVERYDTKADIWIQCAKSPRMIPYFDTIHFDAGGLFYVLNIFSTSYPIGGHKHMLQVYSPATDTWQESVLSSQPAGERLMYLSYKLPSNRKCTAVYMPDTNAIELYNGLGQKWGEIDLHTNVMTCCDWKSIIPKKVYSGHGVTVILANRIFLLNSISDLCGMHDHETGYTKLVAPCPARPLHGQRAACSARVSRTALKHFSVIAS